MMAHTVNLREGRRTPFASGPAVDRGEGPGIAPGEEAASPEARAPNIVVIGEPGGRGLLEEARRPVEWTAGPASFAGAGGLSPLRELAWALGLVAIDGPTLCDLL